MQRIYGLTGVRLPIHPQPYPDELFTHWFYRLAHRNHLKTQTLADYAFGRYSSFWARDQDKLASPRVIERLADMTGQDPDDIRRLTLAAYEGKVYANHNPRGNTRWILPLGIYHRTWRHFGLQYCPLCLFEDAEPYYRRAWRLAMTTVCEKHGVMMYDRCHRCGVPVMFFRNDLGHRSRHSFKLSAKCHACGTDLSRAPAYGPLGPDGQALAMLRALGNAIDMGWWWAGSETIPFGHLYFDVLHALATLLASGKGRKLLTEVERRLGTAAQQNWPPSPKIALEHRSVEERHWLVLSALWLLQEWPERFVDTCQAARMWQSWLLRGESFPWWFEHVVKERLDQSIYRPNADEVKSIVEWLTRSGHPVTRESVGQLLGSRNHQAVVGCTEQQKRPWPKTDEDYCRLLTASEVLIQSLSPGSVRQRLAERDRAIFTVMRATGWGAARVVQLKCSDANMMLESDEDVLGSADRDVLLRYTLLIRPSLTGMAQREALFVGYGTDGISVDALAHRLKALIASRWI